MVQQTFEDNKDNTKTNGYVRDFDNVEAQSSIIVVIITVTAQVQKNNSKYFRFIFEIDKGSKYAKHDLDPI